MCDRALDIITLEETMARHKKIERKKELDRRRKRRKENLKARIREAIAQSQKA